MILLRSAILSLRMLLPPTGSVPNGSDLFVALTDTGVHVIARGECRWGLGVWDHPGGFLAICGWFLSQNRSVDAPGVATDEDEEDGCRPDRPQSAAPVVLWRRPPRQAGKVYPVCHIRAVCASKLAFACNLFEHSSGRVDSLTADATC